MESNNGEAKIQKVKNWSPVWIFPIVTALIGARRAPLQGRSEGRG